MTALDFPTSPADNATSNGYIYDSAKGVWNVNELQRVARFTVSDTAPASAENGDAWFDTTSGLTYVYYNDGDTTQWVETGNPVLSFNTLSNLADTTITTPADGQALVYDNATSKWINKTPATTLDGLTDTVLSSPANGEALLYDGSDWVNRSIPEPLSPFLLGGM